MNTPMSPQIDIDPEQLCAHVSMLFAGLSGFVPLRCIPEKGTPPAPISNDFIPVDEVANRLENLAKRAARAQKGFYCVPCTVRSKGSAKSTDIWQTRVVPIDLDTGDIDAAQALLTDRFGSPSLVVASGGVTETGIAKRHLYWCLDKIAEGADLERVKHLRAVMIDLAQGDPAFKSLHQPIRLAGTIHAKNGLRRQATILRQSDACFSLETLEAACPGLQTQTGPQRTNTAGLPWAILSQQQFREGGMDQLTRHVALSSAIGHWLRESRLGRCSREDARSAVADFNDRNLLPPYPQDKVNRDFEALRIRDRGKTSEIGGQTERLAAPPLSQDAIALHLIDVHGDVLRYTAAWGKWSLWTPPVWTQDETAHVQDCTRNVCRAVAAKAETGAAARRIASTANVGAVLKLARSDKRVSTPVALWDAHPYLLNTAGGVIDLRTGEVHPANPSLLLTQSTSVAPGGECPRWLAFLNDVTDGDRDLQAYLQRLAGYCLTGDTSEQVFVFLYGLGANGKSVFLQTIAKVLGSYAATATQETFMASKTDRHLSELAGLRAARLVTIGETELGRSWAESRIKMITGGEKLRANFMRQDHFEFTPQFKLIIAGNHPPALSGMGEAMRRRLHVVPFDVTIPPERRDRDLAGRLWHEAGGILAWMIEGCALWRASGLAPPSRVQETSRIYFEDQDLTGQWIEEQCVLDLNLWESAKALYENWQNWAQAAGHTVGSQKSLGHALKQKGLSSRKKGLRGWDGIALRQRLSSGEN